MFCAVSQNNGELKLLLKQLQILLLYVFIRPKI